MSVKSLCLAGLYATLSHAMIKSFVQTQIESMASPYWLKTQNNFIVSLEPH